MTKGDTFSIHIMLLKCMNVIILSIIIYSELNHEATHSI